MNTSFCYIVIWFYIAFVSWNMLFFAKRIWIWFLELLTKHHNAQVFISNSHFAIWNEKEPSLTCREAVVVSIVVTTTLLMNSYPAVHRNTEATPNDATTMNTQINLLKKKFFIKIGIITKNFKMIMAFNSINTYWHSTKWIKILFKLKYNFLNQNTIIYDRLILM